MIDAINEVISSLEAGYPLSKLYNILGDLHWMTGFFSLSLKEHIESERIARCALDTKNQLQKIEIKLKNLKGVSFLNRGLVYLDLYDFEAAKEMFLVCKSLGDGNFHSRHSIQCSYCLAFPYSQIGRLEDARSLVKFVEDNADKVYTTWGKGYITLFLGMTQKSLGNWQKAFQYYQEAIQYAEESSYTQVKGKALIYLAEFYREHGDYEKAITHHIESIQKLEMIGARCDLAEAYLYLGLTYRAMGDDSNASKYRNEAVQLFTEVAAPKQVERVKLAFENVE